MKLFKKKWFWLIIIILVIIVFFVFRGGKNKTKYITDEAKKTNIIKTVSATGTASALKSFNLSFPVSGLISDIKVKVGDKVSTGQILARLNQDPLFFDSERYKANYETGLKSAELDLAAAKEDLTNALAVNKEKLDQANTKVKNAKEYHDALEDYADKIKDDSGSSSSAYKLAYSSFISAENSYKETKDNLALVKKQIAEDEANARQNLADAEENLNQKKASLSSGTLSYNYATYLIAKNSFENGSLKAPLEGIITGVNNEIGEYAGPTKATISMISENLQIKVNIPEADISKIEIGKEAKITFDAFGEETIYTGKILEIEPAETLISDVVYYKTTISLEDNSNKIKPGMTANITVQIANKENVLSIPQIAVNEQNGAKYVYALKNNQKERISVQTGVSGDDGRIEITSGLSEGEIIIVSENK